MAEDRTPRTVGPSEVTGDPLTPQQRRKRREHAPKRHRDRDGARPADNFPEIGSTIPDEVTGPPSRRMP